MKKIKVLQLAGCSWCQSLMTRLSDFNLQYEAIDVDTNENLADSVEDFLKTNLYPIVIVENYTKTTYVYRPVDIADAGINNVSNKIQKIGCLSIDNMITQILDI
jgi:glutaredoxin